MSATQNLLDFAAAEHALPAQTRADAVRLFGDTLAIGAAAAAVGAPGEAQMLQAARAMGSGGVARLIATDERLPAHSAALGAAIDRRGGGDAVLASKTGAAA
ncbi:MAG: hypothetical protein ABJP34_00065 [Erythrobacter sp.]